MPALQDVVVIAVAAAAAAWLARGFLRRLGRGGCGSSAPTPPGQADAFVPIDRLTTPEKAGRKTRSDP